MHPVNKAALGSGTRSGARLAARSNRAPRSLVTRTAAVALVAAVGGAAVAGCLGEDTDGPGRFGNVPGGPNGVGPGPVVDVNGTPGTPGSGTPGEFQPDGIDVIGQNQGVDIGGPTVDGDGNPIPPEQLAPLEQCATPAPRLIRRLSAPQFNNTLADVFGAGLPVEPVLTDPAVLAFRVDADAPLVRDLDAELLMNYSEQVADFAIENGRLNQYVSCQNAGQQNCEDDFIRNLGNRISRGQFPQERIAAYRVLFDGEGATFQQGMKNVVMALIQSPYNLYRRELGTQQGGEFQLSPAEVASQLSYFLTDKPPDQALRQAVEQNRFSSTADIDREAERLLATGDAQNKLKEFVEGWIETDGLPEKAKAGETLTPSIREAMQRETGLLFQDVLSNGGGMKELLTANYTYVNAELANFYGLPSPGGTEFAKVEIPAGVRDPGILGQGSFLSARAQPDNSSPVQRAFIVRERILCDELPEVPQNLDTNLKAPAPGATNRERYFTHSSNQVCYACHQMMDPIGYTFENYDGFGKFRDTEVGKPIDSSGALLMVPENVEVPLDGVASLVSYMGQLEDVRACMVRFMSYYAYGRDEWENKVCNDHAIRGEARAAGNSLKSMLMGVLHAPSFTRRGPEQPPQQ
jgi:hypothetical protein